MKKSVCLIIVFLCLCINGFSQPYVDIFNSKYEVFPEAKIKGSNGQTVSSALSNTTLFLPLEQKNKDVAILILNYYSLQFNMKGENANSSNLSGGAAYIGYNKQWKNEKLKTLFLFFSKMNASFSQSTANDFQFGGLVLFDYKKKENLRYHFGAYYNREYFGNFFIPLIGIDWKINKSLQLFGDLPNALNLEKKISNKVYAGAVYTSCLATYRPGKSFTKGDFVREGDPFWGHNELRLYLSYYLTKHLVVYAEVGHTYGRIFQLYRGEEEVEQTNYSYRKINDTFLYDAGIAYRFRLD